MIFNVVQYTPILATVWQYGHSVVTVKLLGFFASFVGQNDHEESIVQYNSELSSPLSITS